MCGRHDSGQMRHYTANKTIRSMKGYKSKLIDMTLPVMFQTGSKLRRLLDLPSTQHQRIQAVLLRDPGATVAVFRELERIRPGAREQVGDAAHAISLIGLDRFRRLLDSLPEIQSGLGDLAQNPGPAIAYSQAAHAAGFAAALAEQTGIRSGQEIATAALLQNPAILALWLIEPDSAQRATYAMRDGLTVDVAFGAELGEPLDDVNRRLGEAWAFPSLAQQALGDWDEFSPRPQIVKLADGLAQLAAAGWEHADNAIISALLAEFLSVEVDQARSWLHRCAVDSARELHALGYPLPGFELMFIPGEHDHEDDHAVPKFGAWRERLEARKAAKTAPELHKTMGEIMHRIRLEAGATRVMFAMLSRDRRHLRTRLALGGSAEDALRKLDLETTQRNLFTVLLSKSQSLWLRADNLSKYQTYLTETVRHVINTNGAYMMSVFIDDKPLGLMYADGDKLDDEGYKRFRLCCQQAARALSGNRR